MTTAKTANSIKLGTAQPILLQAIRPPIILQLGLADTNARLISLGMAQAAFRNAAKQAEPPAKIHQAVSPGLRKHQAK